MAKKYTEIKEPINALSKKELVEIVLKLAANKDNYNYILVNYLDKQGGEVELLEDAKNDIDDLKYKRYKGFAEQQKLANLLSACTKRINDFTKVSKNKKLEADLILYVLQIPFSLKDHMFGTCFTAFDYKVGVLVKRLVTIITKKLEPDFILDYRNIINEYLEILHRRSNHINTIYYLPKMIE